MFVFNFLAVGFLSFLPGGRYSSKLPASDSSVRFFNQHSCRGNTCSLFLSRARVSSLEQLTRSHGKEVSWFLEASSVSSLDKFDLEHDSHSLQIPREEQLKFLTQRQYTWTAHWQNCLSGNTWNKKTLQNKLDISTRHCLRCTLSTVSWKLILGPRS